MTEKSLWPIMMGRLVLIQARPRFMSWFQSYIGYDFSQYIDLEYDSIDGWTHDLQQERTECMIDSNRMLIENAREIWHVHRQDLKLLGDSLPQKIYQRFCTALDLLQ